MVNEKSKINVNLNSRSSTIQSICSSFIPNNYYEKLLSCEHSIVIGPRGSGKTTLLKMLQPEAISVWKHEQAEYYSARIEFTGVFISTDRMWKTHFDEVKATGSEEKINLCLRIFELHILEKIISTNHFISRQEYAESFRYLELDNDVEAGLVAELSEIIGVKPKIPSLRSLSLAIAMEKVAISNHIKTGNNSIDNIDSVEIVSTIGLVANAINMYSGNSDLKWCILFDELELAPEEFIQPLIDSMRGGPDNVILKLAMSPYHKSIFITETTDSSMRNEDFTLVNLSINDSNTLTFAKRLFNRALDLEDDFELKNIFEEPREDNTLELFKSLYSKDVSFKKYMDKQNIDLDKFEDYTESDVLPRIRKVKNIVRIRNSVFNKTGRKRSLKRPLDIYAGLDTLLKSVEYNPRMIIGMSGHFKNHVKNEGFVPIHVQLKVLDLFLDSFNSLLSTIKLNSGSDKVGSAHDLINMIAEYFRQQILAIEFVAEPRGSLVFRKDQNKFYSEAIGCCLNAGALVAEEPVDDLVDITKARCRLSYIFSARYYLLSTLQREVDFSDLVSFSDTIKVHHPYDSIRQLELL